MLAPDPCSSQVAVVFAEPVLIVERTDDDDPI